MPDPPRYIGCAGWGIPAAYAPQFPGGGTHLERYARVFSAVEINSSFYRPHRPDTYRRWADSVPDGFRFSVKAPKAITHTKRLAGAEAELDRFLLEAGNLREKLGPILVQLPPGLPLDEHGAGAFFVSFRERHGGEIVLEPRHETWFTPEGERLLESFRIARVAADPPRAEGGGEPSGWRGLAYYRLHGSPKVYYSEYPSEILTGLAHAIQSLLHEKPVWCIFDNTAEGAATGNALAMQDLVPAPVPRP